MIVLGWPDKPLSIKSLGRRDASREFREVKLLGAFETVRWNQSDDALVIEPPAAKLKSDFAIVYKLTAESGPVQK
jgi:hypothetical protein